VPLFYQHTINEHSRLGIWEINEEEEFFLRKVFLQREISHPHKRLQHLAGRYLLQYLFPDFPNELIMIADTRKPYLSNDAFHFSISHCGNFAAAIVSRFNRVGVDIEKVKPLVHTIRKKFLSEKEMEFLSMMENRSHAGNDHGNLETGDPSLDLLTLAWSAKEALYKWFGDGGIDFKLHMQLTGPVEFNNNGFISSPYKFSKREEVPVTVRSQFFNDLVMSYVIS
jgi:phosphopantetheinyl transferase